MHPISEKILNLLNSTPGATMAKLADYVGVSRATVTKWFNDPKEPEIEYTEYTVDELIKDLEKNAASAKDKYDGQYVELTGRLSYVDSDGRYFGIKPLETGLWLESVTCYIKNKEQKENIKEHEVEEKIVVKGKITDVGEILGYDMEVNSIE